MPEKPITGRKRRISSRYLPHLADIAAIFLECDRHVEPTTRRVQDELGLPLTPNTLRNWTRRSAEFRAALEDAEIIAANAAKANPEVRSPRDIAWFQAKIAELRDLHDNGELTDKERAAIRKEIRELTPSLLAPTVGEELKYSVSIKGEHVTDTPLRCLLKPHPDGGYVLLTVNLDDAVLFTTFEFPGGLKTVAPHFENREPCTIKPGQIRFEDRFEPFDVHVYRIRT